MLQNNKRSSICQLGKGWNKVVATALKDAASAKSATKKLFVRFTYLMKQMDKTQHRFLFH